MDDRLKAAAELWPGSLAVVAPDGGLTYADLHLAADRAARRLAALGVGEGDTVATTLPPSLAFCELLFGAPRVGAAVAPINTRLGGSDRAGQARVAGARLTVDRPLDGFEADVEPRHELDLDQRAVLMFTSGTSGEPKAVALTVGNLDAAAAASAGVIGAFPHDRWLCCLPLFHVAGLSILVRAVRSAATVVLHDGFETHRVVVALEAAGVTLVSLVPTMLRRLLDGGLGATPSLRAVLLGGGPIPPGLLGEAVATGLPARCTYGMTESASQVVVTDVGETAGRPVPGAQVRVAPDGEIMVKGRMISPSAVAVDGWLHTGDSGWMDRQGRLHVTGRIKEMIVTGGEKVAPAAVEAVLLEHPAVADVGVAGTPSREWGEAVTAFLVLGRPVTDYELEAFARERLPGYCVPKRFVRVEHLPRNAAGKLVRGELAGLH